jgi:predicted nucleic acid-binding protein
MTLSAAFSGSGPSGRRLSAAIRSHGVEVADALIAANALANNAELWTRNRKHYPMAGISFFDAVAV